MANVSNFFTDQKSLKTIDSKRIIYLMVAIVFFLLTEAGRFIYRPFIYKNNINDFGIADSIGNSGGIVVQIFLTLAMLNSSRTKQIRIVGFLVIGYILYEILQPYLPKGVFDWKDVFGTIAGGIIALFVLYIMNQIVTNKVIYEFK